VDSESGNALCLAKWFDWLSTDPLILRRPAVAGRLEGCSPGGAACVAMARDARALPALLTMRLKESDLRPEKLVDNLLVGGLKQ
jgi:hypothetical protein